MTDTTNKMTLIRHDSVTEIIDEKLDIQTWNSIIGATTGVHIFLGNDHMMWMDEDGIPKKRPLNGPASARAGFVVLGDVLIMHEACLSYFRCESCATTVRGDHECPKAS